MLASGLTIGQLVKTALGVGVDATPGRITAAVRTVRASRTPQKDRPTNKPEQLSQVLAKLNELRGGMSLADAIEIPAASALNRL